MIVQAQKAGQNGSSPNGAINGSAVARKTSFLRDKLGERLFAPGIRIVNPGCVSKTFPEYFDVLRGLSA